MKTIQIKAYNFDDLSERDKSSAYEKFLESVSKEVLNKLLWKYFKIKLETYSPCFILPRTSKFTFDLSASNAETEDKLSQDDLLNLLESRWGNFYEIKEENTSLLYFEDAFIRSIQWSILHECIWISVIELAKKCVLGVIHVAATERKRQKNFSYFERLCRENNWLFNKDGEFLSSFELEVAE